MLTYVVDKIIGLQRLIGLQNAQSKQCVISLFGFAETFAES